MRKWLNLIFPSFLLRWYHFCWALFSAMIFGFPSQKLKVIGITGTKGKSSTLFLAGRILEKKGYKVGWLSSLSLKIREKEYINPYHLTMPGRGFVQKFMKKALKKGVDFFLLEVTSEGIKQYRHKFINFDTVVFTNLQPEHLESHGGWENYKKAKKELFLSPSKFKTIIANLDDKNSDFFLDASAKSKIGFSINPVKTSNKVNQIIKPREVKVNHQGTYFKIKDILLKLNLLGNFNLYNALAAISIALSYKVEFKIIKEALEGIEKIEGRMEEIKMGQNFRVFVDLAHTPDSFKEVFEVAKLMQSGDSKIIAVFGSAGGGRDKWKRPVLGKIASQSADVIILANEDPYNEPAEDIIEDIARGIPEHQYFLKIPSRREAINKALKLAKKNDIVLILGKGTEATYIERGKKYSWDDRKITKEELKNLPLK